VLPLKNSNAEETAAMLQKVFGSSLSVTPETRTNSLIIRADAETLAEVKKLLDKVEALDGGVPSPRKK
jgi:type II secretory pathway component GspD/PulD (secretin)